MQNFKSFIAENLRNNMPYWVKQGSRGYTLQDHNEKQSIIGMKALVENLYGPARGAGTSVSSSASHRPNKFMNFQYGFSNSTMSSYYKLNGKPFSSINELYAIGIKNGISEDNYSYVLPFGPKGYLLTYDENAGVVYYENSSDLADEFGEHDFKKIDKMR